MYSFLITESFNDRIAKSKWVWHRKWTLVRCIFTVSRYLPFFGIGMTFAGEQSFNHSFGAKIANCRWLAALRTQYYPGESVSNEPSCENVPE